MREKTTEYQKMAAILAKKLTDAEFTKLSELIDNDAYLQMGGEIDDILQKRHPEIFASKDEPVRAKLIERT